MKNEIENIKEEIEKKLENKKFWLGDNEELEAVQTNYEKTFLELREKTIESKIIYFLNRFRDCQIECEVKTETMPNSSTFGHPNDRCKLNLQCFSANDNILKLYFEKGDLLGSGLGRVLLTPLKYNSGIKEKERVDYHIKHGDELLMIISTKKKHLTEEMLIPHTSIGFGDCVEIKLGEKTEICKERDAIIQTSAEEKVRHELELRQHALSLKQLANEKLETSVFSESFVSNKPDDSEKRKDGVANWEIKNTTTHKFLY